MWGLSLSPPHMIFLPFSPFVLQPHMAFLPHGLCMCCILCLTFSAPSLPHPLPCSQTPIYPFGPGWGLPPLRRQSVLAALDELLPQAHTRTPASFLQPLITHSVA